MLRERAKIIAQLLVAVDLFGLLLAFFAAYFIRQALFSSSHGDLDLLLQVRALLLAWPLFALAFYFNRLYESFRLRSLLDELLLIGNSCLWATLALITLVFILKYQFVSRAFLLAFAVLSFLMVGAQRLFIRSFARAARSRGYNTRKIVLVGSGEKAKELAELIHESSFWGLKLIGRVLEDGDSQSLPEVPLLGSLGNFSAAIAGCVVDGVIFAVPCDQIEKIRQAFMLCREVGIPAYLFALPFDDLSGPVKLEDLGGRKLLMFPTTVPDDYQLFWKRVFDIVTSIVLLVLFAPIMLLAVLLIKLTSPGPVIFRQVRAGMNGRLFTLYKFRTMRADAERVRSSIATMNEMDGPVFKIRKDPRTTPIGQFLRRTSIDEFPQLFNVLMGHMSIVGPRPPLPEEVEKYERWQRRRLSVRPGLTCLWQVSGRNRIDFQTWMKLDLEYVDNWSWLLDFKIILRTIPAMLRGS